MEKTAGNDIIRRGITVQCILVGCLVLGFWVLYAAAAVFDVDLLHERQAPAEFAVRGYLWTSLVVTVAAIPILIRIIRRGQRLASSGVETDAVVVGISDVAGPGSRPVTFAFVANGSPCKVKRDVAEFYVRRYEEGTRVRVIYDPANPRQCEIIYGACLGPVQETIGDTVPNGLRELVLRLLPAVLIIASIVLVFGACQLFGGDSFDIKAWGLRMLLGALILAIVADTVLQRYLSGGRTRTHWSRWVLVAGFAFYTFGEL